MKARYLEEITRSGVVAVIRANSAEELKNITLALNKGGVKALEITMTSLELWKRLRRSPLSWGTAPL